ncbi:carbohydrate porin [Spirosoma sp. HMF4905]|uniref:Carbohydrate porin n=1 Tax=Spirosoma arboris TaxID=2682092 RepID=A0A7K1SFR4_9BACT|nr:carbohydrate porin [Spirosoma arboris]MVM32642.1 carbohydrate porin [Spirosoma arboris]
MQHNSKTHYWFGLFFLLLTGSVQAQQDNNNNYLDSLQNWSLHFQFTTIAQGHTGFKGAGYDGRNTLSAQPDTALSVTTTLFLGRRLWRGAAVYLNPELAGGRGVGHRNSQSPYDESLYAPAVGIAGFPNGETFRIGSARPALYIARFYIEQIIRLDKSPSKEAESDANQVEEPIPASRLVITAGKFSIADIFDNNAYAHDPRSQFFNWALMNMGAWDYPANTRGYTWSLATEYIRPTYAIRVAASLMPIVANGNVLDWNIGKSNALTLELEHKFKLLRRAGTVRLLGFRNVTKAPTYTSATQLLQAGTYPTDPPYILTGTNYGGVKYGLGLNFEQPLGDVGGIFGRASWNNGQTATWAFTEIDRSFSLGAYIGGTRWHRQNDVVGIAVAKNGISAEHAAFLNAGGSGFMLGDGSLPNYKLENSLEMFYKARLAHTLYLTLDYQLVQNPGYNGDRGPVNLFALRTHVEF